MGRTVVKRDQEQDSKPAQLDKAPLVGGTTGEPDDPNPKSQHIYGLNDIAPARVEDDRIPEVVPRVFRVTGGPPEIMYDGQRVRCQVGNTFKDSCTDIDLLRRQGVKLEEVTG